MDADGLVTLLLNYTPAEVINQQYNVGIPLMLYIFYYSVSSHTVILHSDHKASFYVKEKGKGKKLRRFSTPMAIAKKFEWYWKLQWNKSR